MWMQRPPVGGALQCRKLKEGRTEEAFGGLSLASDDTRRELFDVERPTRDLGMVSSLNGFATLMVHVCQNATSVI